MSREIKFRVWDKEENEMVCWKDISRTNSLGIFVNNHNRNDSRGILSQYTGLKDKNGVEIYEGDIVRKSHGRYKIGVVVFRQGAFCFESRNNGVYAGDECFTQLHTMHYIECKLKVEYKVIGNIYENPELLS